MIQRLLLESETVSWCHTHDHVNHSLGKCGRWEFCIFAVSLLRLRGKTDYRSPEDQRPLRYRISPGVVVSAVVDGV